MILKRPLKCRHRQGVSGYATLPAASLRRTGARPRLLPNPAGSPRAAGARPVPQRHDSRRYRRHRAGGAAQRGVCSLPLLAISSQLFPMCALKMRHSVPICSRRNLPPPTLNHPSLALQDVQIYGMSLCAVGQYASLVAGS